jgi:hypothetical protein
MSLTDENKKARLGKFTASSIEAICKPKGLGQTGASYVFEKIAEILTGQQKEIPTTKAMQWGVDIEAVAVAHLSQVLKMPLTKNEDTLTHDSLLLCGTPDIIINDVDITGFQLNCGVELKCPNSDTHLTYGIMASGDDLKKEEPKYYWQIVAYMLLTGFDSWIFVSYDPRVIEPKKRMYIFTIKRNEEDILFLTERIKAAEVLLNDNLKLL